ncbi:hypothetical protein PHMEG_0007321 [Phytophthora megakarya]|uniref:TKL protein kinase n=1 Tax=Phytophthora megakarya TaxID=4795 RepID=A0A225WM73_9STRA|nr:hypothetical protein PHMEG_0007321 [Phytophthora megakarya]
MKIPSSVSFLLWLLSTAILIIFVCGHDGEDGKWLLTTYSEDQNCSKIVYVDMEGMPCPTNDSCVINTDDDGLFEKSIGKGCVTDRDAYLETVFKGVPYLKIESYSTNSNCTVPNGEEVAEIMGFLADGECHPHQYSHFKVVESEGTISVLFSWDGCDTKYWNTTWTGKAGVCSSQGEIMAYLLGKDNSSAANSASSSGSTKSTGSAHSSTSTSSACVYVASTMAMICFTMILVAFGF